jgi:tetratricopeptide (TPR) repeat protein
MTSFRLRFLSFLLVIGLGTACSRTETITSDDPIADGWMAYQLVEYKRAHNLFALARAKAAPGSEEEAAAIFAQATTFWQERPNPDPKRARELFEKVATTVPKSDLAPWSLLAIARIETLPRVADVPRITQAERDRAIAAYERVQTTYPDHPAAEEAFVLQQAATIASLERTDCERAVERLMAFLNAKPNSRYRSHAWAVLGNACEQLERWPERLNAMIQSLETVEIDASNPLMLKPFHYWSIATVAEYKVGDLATARTYYQLLMEKFPRDLLTYSCKLALQRLDKLEADAVAGTPAAAPSGP